MAKGDVITRKDIIQDDALNWGPEYAEQMKIAIKKNEEFLKGIKDIVTAQKGIKGADNNSTYLKAKEEERLAFIKNMNAIREQAEAEKQLEKIKQEFARTAKLELDAQNKLEASKRRNTSQSIEERVAQQAENKVLRQAALEKLGLVSAYDKLNKSRTDAKNKLRDLIATENSSTESIKKAQKEFDVLDGKVKKADDAVRDFTKNVGNYPTIGKLTAGVKDLANAFGIAASAAAFAALLKNAIAVVKEFDQSIADLKAITGASGKDLDFLKKNAIDMGKGVKGGAVAVVEAYKLIASAKPELLENVDALNAVTKATITLSQASGLELPDAASRLTDAMNQFGADASEAAYYVDVLAAGAKYGSAEIPQITDALLQFGAVAKSSNVNIEESTALIELLAEKGIKGAEAGTKLRNVLLKLSAPDALPKEAQQYLEKMGISMETLKDKSLPVQQRLEALKPIIENDAAAVKIFGAENVVAAKSILGNTERLKELTSQMNENGVASEQAEIRMDTLDRKTEKMSSTYDSLILSLNEGSGVVSGFFKFFVDGATNALEKLIRLNTSWDELYDKASKEGAEKGTNSFIRQFNNLMGTGSDSEIAETIKSVAQRNIKLYRDKLNEAIENGKTKSSGISLYGITITENEYNLEVEKLKGFIAAEQAIIDESNKKQNESSKKAKEDEIKLEEEQTEITKEELEKRKKLREEYLKRLQKLDADAFALMKFRLEQEIEISNDIADNENESIDDRIDAYLNAQQVEIALAKETAKRKLEEISKYNDGIRDLSSSEIQTLINGGQIKKKLTDDEILVLEEYAAKQKEIDNRISENKQKITDSIIEIENKKNAIILKNQDTELNKKLLRENQDFQDTLNALEGNQKAIEDATKDHEARVLNIKKEAIKEALQEEINATKKLIDEAGISADVKAKLLNKLSKLELELSQVGLDSTLDKNAKKLLSDEEYAEKIKDMTEQLVGALSDLTNALFDAKIQNIDNEIQKNDEYYAKQIESAGNDARQKELLEVEAEKKRQVLEKKKRKEQTKQAIFNKALNITEIGLKTAQAVVAALAVGPPQGYVFAALSAVLGAAQLAAAIATPIPKYKMGRKGGKEEFAIVGDGGVNEIIERKSGKLELTPATDTLVKLYEGDSVHSSAEEFNRLKKASFMSSLSMDNKKISDYEAMKHFDKNLLDSKIENAITNGFKKAKNNIVVNVPKQDIDHELWKSNFGNFKK